MKWYIVLLPLVLGCPANYILNGINCIPCPLQYERRVNETACRKRATFCAAPRLSSAANCTDCAPDAFVESVCTASQNNVCRPCLKCDPSQYMVRECSKFLDRQCDNCNNNIPANSVYSGECSWRCKPGYYNVSAQCVLCATGYQCDGVSSLICKVGSYSTAPGATTCFLCPQGTFSGATGTSSCANCGVASFTDNAVCRACDAGYFQNTVGATTCNPCPANSFCAFGSTQPSPCPGTSTSRALSASLYNCTCPQGQYGKVEASASTCLPCPLDHYCNNDRCGNPI